MPDTILQFWCRRITDHRWRKLIAYSEGIKPVEYHYRCRVCRKRFWNYTAKPDELRRLNHRVLCREVKNSQKSEVLDLEVKKEGEG